MPTSLITGGAGFIGSHLAETLLQRGEHVIVVDDLSTGRSQNIAHIVNHPNLEWIHRSVDDAALMAQVVDRADRVYHLAAAVGVALIARQPVQTIERNIYPTKLILDRLGKRADEGDFVPCFIASTSEVYARILRILKKCGLKKMIWCLVQPPSRDGATESRKRSMSFWRSRFLKNMACRS